MDPGERPIKVSSLGLDSRIVKHLKQHGITTLHPPQAKAIGPALEGKNLLLATPTASGKSLIAYLAILQKLRDAESGERAFYIVPLKALANEKVEELRNLAETVGLTVGIAIGDRDGESGGIENSDIVVCTSEKMDSILRNNPTFSERLSIIIADEFHLINDSSRGPTLEVLLARLRHLNPDAQRIALSATVGNPRELAQWLDAELIESEWRPVSLQQGTLTGLDLEIHRSIGPSTEANLPEPRTLEGKKTKITNAILEDTIVDGGQMILFVKTRASAEKEARELGAKRGKSLTNFDEFADEVEELEKLAKKISKGEDSSNLSDRLSNAIKGGVAFHHAGLTGKQRNIVEQAFKEGLLKCICATPTLAAGVNLPARRVVIRDWTRWDGTGSKPISVMEIQQMQGRAGRPAYDDHGESWIMVKNDAARDKVVEKYLFGEPEDVRSQLEDALLSHVLSSIASGGLTDRDALGRFFDQTLLAQQIRTEELKQRIDSMIDWLVDKEMISRDGESNTVIERIQEREKDGDSEEDWEDEIPSWAAAATALDGLEWNEPELQPLPKRKGPAVFGFSTAAKIRDNYELEMEENPAMTYSATSFGDTISRLYLNPVSGHILRRGLRRSVRIIQGLDENRQLHPRSLIHLVSCTPDFISMWVKSKESEEIEDFSEAMKFNKLLTFEELNEVEIPTDIENENMRIKALCVLEEWMEEKSMREIEAKFDAHPGDVRTRVELAEWLLYSSRRMLALDEEVMGEASDTASIVSEYISETQRRIRYGCKADILGLIAIRNVGRVRAREMKGIGLESIYDVSEMGPRDRSKLEGIRGWSPKLVETVITNAQQIILRKK
ncbi:MAG: hypothetical protein CMB31_01600 [Euryarchaeota archaeon]|nr:hypothetical protein [Euryarchaeota archaeon]